MKKVRYGKIILISLILMVGAVICIHSASFTLDKTQLTGKDQHNTLLTIHNRGRYSIQAVTKTGAALSVVDRMAGILATDERLGEGTARIDINLEKGEYKIRVNKKDTESAALSVFEFKEHDQTGAVEDRPELPDFTLIESSLEDYHQRSYWIHVPEKTMVRFEALGRTLKACTIWKDAAWIVDAAHHTEIYEPVPGKPHTYIEVYQELEQGYYLIVFAGGEKLKWANEDNTMPLYIRRGVEYLGESGKKEVTVSPFGRDAFLISGKTDYIQAARDEKKPTTLYTSYYSDDRPRHKIRRSAEITTSSRLRYCELSCGNRDGQWLGVKAAPGSTIDLTYFIRQSTRYDLESGKSYWLSGIAGYSSEHALDLTPVLTHGYTGAVLKEKPVAVTSDTPLIRKFNLLGHNSVYITIEKDGEYYFVESDRYIGKAHYTLRLIEKSGKQRDFPQQPAGKPFNLVKGLYKLEIKPLRKGIIHLAFFRQSKLFGMSLKDITKTGAKLLAADEGSPVNYFTWPSVGINTGNYKGRITINERAGIPTGMVVRKLPMDLHEALPVTLEPGRSVDVRIQVTNDSRLKITGNDFSLKEGDRRLGDGAMLGEGLHTLVLTNTATGPNTIVLVTEDFEPAYYVKPTLKPLDQLFTIFTESKPVFENYERNQKHAFILRVERPSFYRLETSGRLAMAINVRTAMNTSLFIASKNGIARNALIQTYFNPGDYLVEVQALGQSLGRAGVTLTENRIIDAGNLVGDFIERATVEENTALKYTVPNDEEGTYSIETIGLTATFSYRFEDADGFPLHEAVDTGACTASLKNETYTYYSMPFPMQTKRLTRMWGGKGKTAEPLPERTYHLTVNNDYNNTWIETPEKTPDVYHFTLSAPVKGRFFLTENMAAEITGGASDITRVEYGGKTVSLDLDRGTYRIAVRSVEENNQYPYVISYKSDDLIPGEQKTFYSFPQTIPVSLGEESIAEFWSFGSTDIKATLYNEAKTEVLAVNDDADNDWNFFISRKLAKGRYYLKVENTAYRAKDVTVYLNTKQESISNEERIPFNKAVDIGHTVVTVPVATGDSDALVRITARAKNDISLAIYNADRLLAEGRNTLYIPLTGGAVYNVKAYHHDRATIPVTLDIAEVQTAQITIDMPVQKNITQPAVLLHNAGGISFIIDSKADSKLGGNNGDLLYSPGLERPLVPVSIFPDNTLAGSGYLVRSGDLSIGEIHLEPLSIDIGKGRDIMLDNELEHGFTLTHDEDMPVLIRIESQGVLTGAALTMKGKSLPAGYTWDHCDIMPSLTIAGINTPGRYTTKIWNTTIEDSQKNKASVLMERYRVQEELNLDQGTSRTVTIQPNRAVTVVLPNAKQELSLLLAKGMAAFAWNKGICEGVKNALGQNQRCTMLSTGGKLTIINTSKKAAPARIDLMEQQSMPVITMKAPYEKVLESAGRVELMVDTKGGGDVLCVYGDNTDVVLKGSDGKYYYGNADPADPLITVIPAHPGVLTLSHGGGFIKAYVADHNTIVDTFVGYRKGKKEKITASGEAKLYNMTQLWNLTVDRDMFIDLTLTGTGVAALYAGKRILASSAGTGSEQRSILHYLPKGAYTLFTRPAAGYTQDGDLTVRLIEPTALPGGDHETQYFIGPGEKHVYTFTVTADNLIGAGVATDQDAVEARLFDGAFVEQGRGQLIFERVKAGTYYLVIHSPDVPVQYTPLVYGADGSRTDIPYDVIKKYQQ